MIDLPDYLKDRIKKPLYAYEMEQYTLSVLQSYYSAHRIKGEVAIGNSPGDYVADFVVFRPNGEAMILVEVKAPEYIVNDAYKRLIYKISPLVKNAYFILTDGANALMGRVEENRPEVVKLSDALGIIKHQEGEGANTIAEAHPNGDKLKSIICQAINESVTNEKCHHPENYQQQIDTLISCVKSIPDDGFQYMEGDQSLLGFKPEVEPLFFRYLLGQREVDSIVKFTTARSLYQILDGHKVNMCSLVCMNDPSEKDYADTETGIPNTEGKAEDSFIISACEAEKETDLTMWRLYGDDAKGICIRFDVQKDKVNEKGFTLAPVSYANKDGFHFELEVIKRMRELCVVSGRQFVFHNWKIWKHFFKKYQFAIEQEIRLLFLPEIQGASKQAESKWFLDDRTSMYSEMKLFDVSTLKTDFPLVVNKIILGVRFPSNKENAEQINNCFLKSQIARLDMTRTQIVTPSIITDYR